MEESGSSISSSPSVHSEKLNSRQHKERNGEDVDAVDAAMLDIDENKANA